MNLNDKYSHELIPFLKEKLYNDDLLRFINSLPLAESYENVE